MLYYYNGMAEELDEGILGSGAVLFLFLRSSLAGAHVTCRLKLRLARDRRCRREPASGKRRETHPDPRHLQRHRLPRFAFVANQTHAARLGAAKGVPKAWQWLVYASGACEERRESWLQ